jgi:hypothetical protein
MTEPMTDAEYAACGGLKCPFCRSGNLEGDKPEPDGDSAVSDERCLDCEAEWKGIWQPVGYFRLDSDDFDGESSD